MNNGSTFQERQKDVDVPEYLTNGVALPWYNSCGICQTIRAVVIVLGADSTAYRQRLAAISAAAIKDANSGRLLLFRGDRDSHQNQNHQPTG